MFGAEQNVRQTFLNRFSQIGPIKYLFVLFALILIFLVYQTGNYGGDLVKKFGVGTEVITPSDSN